mmetsp:Transcript_119973/g.340112  ORF Transcript_119973/g.340112 Transcript_119973/m.340112 type:complete len:207 (-) Transcript_119973:13-633(-)
MAQRRHLWLGAPGHHRGDAPGHDPEDRPAAQPEGGYHAAGVRVLLRHLLGLPLAAHLQEVRHDRGRNGRRHRPERAHGAEDPRGRCGLPRPVQTPGARRHSATRPPDIVAASPRPPAGLAPFLGLLRGGARRVRARPHRDLRVPPRHGARPARAAFPSAQHAGAILRDRTLQGRAPVAVESVLRPRLPPQRLRPPALRRRQGGLRA